MEKVIVICGPTASGKTTLAIELAKKINGEIVSCDSMQIYKEMNIGTAKPTLEEQQGIKHYLLDYIEPDQRYSVADYVKDARQAINEIISNKKMPIVVGGTGLYMNSLVEGRRYPVTKFDLEYREELESKARRRGLPQLYERAKEIDPEAVEQISPKDTRRIIRILEIYHATGKSKTQQDIESRTRAPEHDYIVYGLKWERDVLYERIEKRVDSMIEQGLVEEVQGILNKYMKFPTSMQGLGYKEVVEYIAGDLTKEEMIEKIKRDTRRYAKRQMTWFRKNKKTIWLEGDAPVQENVNKIMQDL